MALKGVRHPMYAGSWYDANPQQLHKQISQFYASASPDVDERSISRLTNVNPAVKHPVLAIVVPHAGYVFSGQTAAYAYQIAKTQKVKRVFLLGPSHHVGFHGCALPVETTFETPFGDLYVDGDLIGDLRCYPLFTEMPEVHRVEHSLEMQLPFIKDCFADAPIVPIVVGMLSDQTEIRLAAEILKGYVCEGDLVVVSSDFTHFGPRYQYQPFEQDVNGSIAKLDGRAFRILSDKDIYSFLRFEQETKDTICGFYPLCVLSAMLPGQSQATLLKYATSRDAGFEDQSNSVSYLAIAYSNGNWSDKPGSASSSIDANHLTQSDKEGLLKLARRAVDVYVRTKKEPTLGELGIPVSESMSRNCGVFVTLIKISSISQVISSTANNNGYAFSDCFGTDRIASSRNGHCEQNGHQLRGCIGYIWPLKPLYQAVIDNAVSACCRDHRFHSVQIDELDDIQIEVNVLTVPRRIKSYHEISLGTHGIVLFKDGHQSVFLPEVPMSYGWSLPETLTELAKKAGLAADDWRDGAKYDVFQSVAFAEGHTPRQANGHGFLHKD